MAEIEHFLDPSLKYEQYEKFSGQVENLSVNILDENCQLNGTGPLKIRLREAVDKV
jgi:hypothetical protein